MTTGMRNDLEPSEAARFDEVCRFGQDRREDIATTVALAFADDPIWKWILGLDRTITLDQGMPLARMLVAASSAADEIHGFRHFGAVALWSAPSGTVDAEVERRRDERAAPFREAFGALLGDRALNVGPLGEVMRANRPDEPHWYLGIIGTRPDHQGQGLGSRVLTTMLNRCDRLGLPTYLESSNPRNHAFYARHGYQELGTISALDSPEIMRFRRNPK